jgi:hypothetical protein
MAAMGRKTPLDERPAVDEPDGWLVQQEYFLVEAIIKAFARLSFSRPVGMSLGTIALSEITGYWLKVERLMDELEDWIDMIQALDSIFIDFHAQKSKK